MPDASLAARDNTNLDFMPGTGRHKPHLINQRTRTMLERLGSINLFVLICVLLYFMGAGLAVTLSARLAHAQDAEIVAGKVIDAASQPAPELVTLDKIGRAGLVYKTNIDGSYLFAPEVETDVVMDVTGITARTKVTQTFINPTDQWLEGVYVVPLPDDSAIDHLQMVIGDRIIVAEIKERETARRTYEQARERGQRAALMEQGRPNQFTVSVANIAPMSEITVEMEYQTLIKVDDGLFELRFPMVVAPRYLPRMPSFRAVSLGSPIPDTAGPNDSVVYAEGDGDTLPGGPVLIDPDPTHIHLPVSITVNLNPGFAPSGLISPFHQIASIEGPDNSFTVTLADQMVPAKRDFVLEWQAPLSGGPAGQVFSQTRDGQTFVLGMVVPPQAASEDALPGPREMVFILDVSGSMHGPSIAQAKSALVTALSRLRPVDKFNVIAFSDTSQAVFPDPVAATPNTLGIVGGFIGGLEADGGTEMSGALDMALAMVNRRGEDDTALRQIVLLTDGAVGNEDELFQMIAARLADARLFTIGIGSAPNSWFMRKSANFGRGSYTHIGDVGQVEEKIVALLAKLEAPVLTDVNVTTSDGLELAMTPDRIPDLYRGEPVVFTGELRAADGADRMITITGILNGSPWSTTVDLNPDAVKQSPGVASLWARRRIEAELDTLFEGADETKVREAVLALALDYHLVSPYTSLVAVEDKIVRPKGEDVVRADVPRHLPEGWDAERVFGLSQQPPVQSDRADAGPPPPVMLKAATMPAEAEQVADAARIGGRVSGLPQTATPATIMALVGTGLLAAALLLLFGRRPRRPRRRAGGAL